MAITLGKDCTVSIGGTIASARTVTFTQSAKTIDVDEFGSRIAGVYSVGWDASVSIELNDGSDAAGLAAAINSGTDSLTVNGGAGAWSFPCVVTSVSETDSIDGVATFTVEAKLTRTGLR